jgi:hypothetical protein
MAPEPKLKGEAQSELKPEQKHAEQKPETPVPPKRPQTEAPASGEAR